MNDLFYCPVCGGRRCLVIGAVCEDCRIQAKMQRPHGGERIMGTCFYCKAQQFGGDDHVVPFARGGPETSWNRVFACFICNMAKSDMLPSEWCPTHEAALAIERRVSVIFPRMRHGHLIGDHAPSYARIRSLCANFISSLLAEANGLSKRDQVCRRATSTWLVVDKLQRFVNDIIVSAEARGENEKCDDRSADG